MMKPKYLVHGSYARCVSNPVEVERLLSQGWLIAAPKARTREAKRKRELRSQMRANGWRTLLLWLPPDEAALVAAARLPGEGYAALLVRLVKRQCLTG